VGVQRRHGDPRRGGPHVPSEERVGDAHGPFDERGREKFQGAAQSDVDRDQGDAQPVAGEHHHHVGAAAQVGEELGVAGERDARGPQSLLGDGTGDDRGRLPREDVFRGVLRDAARGIARGAFGIESPLVTLGIRADRPATEYGYLRPSLARGAIIHDLQAYPLEAFEEKPDVERAERLGAMPGVAWNAGMFLWRRRSIQAALEEFAPDVIETVATAHRSGTLADVYPSIRSTSIDYAVMEPAARAGRVVMGAMDVGWTDLGSWSVLLSMLGVEASGRVVQAGELAEAGADDLIVRRRDGRLVLEPGPASGILDADGPSALLTGAASARREIADLITRVSAEEARS